MRQSSLAMSSATLTGDELRKADCVVTATDHDSYDYEWVVDRARLVVDSRNPTRGITRSAEKLWLA